MSQTTKESLVVSNQSEGPDAGLETNMFVLEQIEVRTSCLMNSTLRTCLFQFGLFVHLSLTIIPFCFPYSIGLLGISTHPKPNRIHTANTIRPYSSRRMFKYDAHSIFQSLTTESSADNTIRSNSTVCAVGRTCRH